MHSRTQELQWPCVPAQQPTESRFLVIIVLSLLAVSLLWPSYGEWKLSGVPNIAPPRLLKVLLLVWLAYRFAWCGLPFGRLRKRIHANSAIFICLLIYEIFQVIAIILDQNAVTFIRAFIKDEVFSNLLLMFALLLILRDDKDLKKAIEIVSIAGLVIGILVVIESVLKSNFFSRVISDGNVGTAFAMMDKSRDMNYRSQGPFSHPLLLATYCAGALPLCWWAASVNFGWRRIVHILAIVALVVAAYLSHTRSGLVAVLLVLSACILREYVTWLNRCKNKIFAMLTLTLMIGFLIIVIAVAGWYALQIMVGRTVEEASSTNVRLEMLRVGIPKIFEAPFLGYGPSNAAAQAGFRTSLFGYSIDIYFLELGLRAGLIGLFAYVAMYLLTFSRLLRGWFAPAAQALPAFLAFAIASQFYMQSIHALADLIDFLYVIVSMMIIFNEKNRLLPTSGTLLRV